MAVPHRANGNTINNQRSGAGRGIAGSCLAGEVSF
jgi:hypothetical protein